MKKKKISSQFLKKYPGVRIGIIAMILLLVVGVSSAFTIEKEIPVHVDGKEIIVKGKLLDTLELVLTNNNLPSSSEYHFNVEPTSLLKDVVDVKIEKKLSGKIMVDQKEIAYLSKANTVGDLLKEYEIVLGKDDRVEPGIETALTEQIGNITVVRVNVLELVNQRQKPFTTLIKENKDLPQGIREVKQVGQIGISNVKERVRYEDGVVKTRELILDDVITAPVEEIIEVGGSASTIELSEDIVVASTEGESDIKIKDEVEFATEESLTDDSVSGEPDLVTEKERSELSGGMTVSATAYTATGNATASGAMPQSGRTIAAWDGVPLGTEVYIPALGGTFTVEDRGGAVSNGIIDIYMDSESECIDWGRQNLEVFIVD